MDNAQEALFKAMMNEGWFINSNGDVQSPVGFYGYMTNNASDLKEIYEAFSDTVEMYGKPNDDEMLGSWYAYIDSNGIIHISEMANDMDAREAFEESEDAYAKWLDTDEDEV